MKVEVSHQTTVKEIFSSFLIDGNIFSIPIYQREYSWGELQWHEFFEDVKHSFEKDGVETNYWGSLLVFHNQLNKEYEVVDGQQRMVTILLFLISLGRYFGQNEKLPLKFQGNINNTWIKVAQNQTLSKDEKRTVFANAIKYFENNINNYGLKVDSLLNHVYNTQLSLVIIDDEYESNLLFGRLNTRGIRLCDVDLIKHKIFYETERNSGPINNDEVLDKWKLVQTYLLELNTSIDKFLPSWWESKYDIDSISLYDSFQQELVPNDYVDFLDRLCKTAEEISKWRKNNSGNDNKIGRNLSYLLKITSSKKIYTILIAIAEVTFSNKEKVKLLELLTVFEFTRAIIPPPNIVGIAISGWSIPGIDYDFSAVDKIYLDFSKKILFPNIREQDIFEEIKSLKNSLNLFMPQKDDFVALFSNLRWDDKGNWYRSEEEKLLSTYAVYTLNNWLDTTNHGAGVEYRTKDDDEYSIEHILSKSNAKDEYSSEYQIGNLMVLEKTINNDLGNQDLQIKVPEYKKSSYPQVKELIYKNQRVKGKGRNIDWKINNFDSNSINTRGNYLADCFYEKIKKLLEN